MSTCRALLTFSPIRVFNRDMKRPPLRDAAFFTALAAGIVLTIAAGGSLTVLVVYPGLRQGLSALFTHPWWFSYSPGNGNSMILWDLAGITAVSVMSFILAARARAHYHRSGTPLALFLMAYFFIFSLECLRGPSALIFAVNGPVTVTLILSRAVYGGRFAGELILLAVGLYALELKLKRYLLLLGIILLVAFAIAIYLPVDGTAFLSSLDYNLGDEQGTAFAVMMLAILTPLSLIGAAYRTKNRSFYSLAAASALLLGGRQIVDFSVSATLFAAGALSLLAGGVISLSVLAGYNAPEKA
jgi:hypothetical protein